MKSAANTRDTSSENPSPNRKEPNERATGTATRRENHRLTISADDGSNANDYELSSDLESSTSRNF